MICFRLVVDYKVKVLDVSRPAENETMFEKCALI